MDHTNGLTSGEHIEKGCLAGTRGTHEGSEGTGLDVAKDLVEELASAARNRNGVIEVLPSECLGGLGQGSHIGIILPLAPSRLALLEALVELLVLRVLLGEDGNCASIGTVSE